MITHGFTCGCVMNEGDPRSRHPSHDYREVSCDRHVMLPAFVWPHHVDDDVQRIPPAEELLGIELADRLIGTLIRHSIHRS